MEIRLGIWKSNKIQARWHPSRETREPCLGKQGFQRGRAVPPASPTWCRAAAGNHKLLWATAGLCQNPSCSGYPCMCLLGCVSCVVDPWALFMTLALFSHPGGDLQAFSAVWRSMGADNCKQLQLQRSLKPLLQFLCLLPQKHRAGLWIEELGCFILFFLLLAKLLQCLFFHSGALLCPDLVFGFSFPCILAIWFLKAACSSFGFCYSCHLVHLQDKRKKPTGGLPPFYPLTAPLWGSSWSTRTFPLHNGSLGAGWEQSSRAWTSTSRSSGLGAGCQPPWAGLSPIAGFSLVSLLFLVSPTANCKAGSQVLGRGPYLCLPNAE